jgi:hypothetical protein
MGEDGGDDHARALARPRRPEQQHRPLRAREPPATAIIHPQEHPPPRRRDSPSTPSSGSGPASGHHPRVQVARDDQRHEQQQPQPASQPGSIGSVCLRPPLIHSSLPAAARRREPRGSRLRWIGFATRSAARLGSRAQEFLEPGSQEPPRAPQPAGGKVTTPREVIHGGHRQVQELGHLARGHHLVAR